MNRVDLIGRFTADPEIRTKTTDTGEMMIARFSLAVQRKRKEPDGTYKADFIHCVAFYRTAEFIEKYFRKGMRIGVTGSIETGSYVAKDGHTVYTTDVIVDSAEFVDSKSNSDNQDNSNQKFTQGFGTGDAQNKNTYNGYSDNFMNIPDDIDSELPFN